MLFCSIFLGLIVCTAGLIHEKSKKILTPTINNKNDKSIQYFGYSFAYRETIKSLTVGAPKYNKYNGLTYSCKLDDLKGNTQCIILKNVDNVETIINQDKKMRNAYLERLERKILNGKKSLGWIGYGWDTRLPDAPRWPKYGASMVTGREYYITCAPSTVSHVNLLADYVPIYGSYSNRTKPFIANGKCYVDCFNTNVKKCSKYPQLVPYLTPEQRLLGRTNTLEQYDHLGMSIILMADIDTVIMGDPLSPFGRVLISSLDKSKNMYQSTNVIAPRRIKDEDKLTNETQYLKNISENFGYSLSNVLYNEAGVDQHLFGVSTPYGYAGEGQVMVLDTVGKRHWHTAGSEPGLLFGAALCSVDLDRDGNDDLLVGAPAFGTDELSNKGAVFVYLIKMNDDFPQHSPENTIFGSGDESSFGNSLANIGDINNDGVHDVAIGAPYENEHGVVYIYSGATLLEHSPLLLNKLKPTDNSMTFGFNIAPIYDFDDNGCNEVAIGAVETDEVYVYRCINEYKLHIDLKTKNLALGTNNDTLRVFEYCVEPILPPGQKTISSHVEITCEIEHPTYKIESHRKNYVQNQHITSNESNCYSFFVSTPQIFSVRPVPITAIISTKMIDSPMDDESFNGTAAILIESSERFERIWVILRDCSDVECSHTLGVEMNTEMSDPYLVGSSESEQFTFTLSNIGNSTSWQSCLAASLPSNVDVKPQSDKCTFERRNHITIVYCTPVYPFNATQSETFSLTLLTKNLTNEEKSFIVTAEAQEYCKSSSENDTTTHKDIQLQYDSQNIFVEGYIDPRESGNIISISKSDIDSPTGKKVELKYSIYNRGVTHWKNIKCELFLENKPFVKYTNLTIYDEKGDKEIKVIPIDNVNSTCEISNLEPSNDRSSLLMVSLYIHNADGKLKNIQKHQNFTVTLTLHLNGNNTEYSVVGTVSLLDKYVSWLYWCIGVGVAIFFIIILVLILYKVPGFKKDFVQKQFPYISPFPRSDGVPPSEADLPKTGVLKRKNKVAVEQLKKNIHRISMAHESMRLRMSMCSEMQIEDDNSEVFGQGSLELGIFGNLPEISRRNTALEKPSEDTKTE